jgi:hypothetical protein
MYQVVPCINKHEQVVLICTEDVRVCTWYKKVHMSMYWVHTSMYSVHTGMYQYILISINICWACTSMYLIQTSIYKYVLGVYLFTPGCIALRPVWQDLVELNVMQTRGCQTSLQPTGLLYFNTYRYILVHTLYILVHTWSVLSMYKGIPSMIQ